MVMELGWGGPGRVVCEDDIPESAHGAHWMLTAVATGGWMGYALEGILRSSDTCPRRAACSGMVWPMRGSGEAAGIIDADRSAGCALQSLSALVLMCVFSLCSRACFDVLWTFEVCCRFTLLYQLTLSFPPGFKVSESLSIRLVACNTRAELDHLWRGGCRASTYTLKKWFWKMRETVSAVVAQSILRMVG